jgi:hypothetical protein
VSQPDILKKEFKLSFIKVFMLLEVLFLVGFCGLHAKILAGLFGTLDF